MDGDEGEQAVHAESACLNAFSMLAFGLNGRTLQCDKRGSALPQGGSSAVEPVGRFDALSPEQSKARQGKAMKALWKFAYNQACDAVSRSVQSAYICWSLPLCMFIVTVRFHFGENVQAFGRVSVLACSHMQGAFLQQSFTLLQRCWCAIHLRMNAQRTASAVSGRASQELD